MGPTVTRPVQDPLNVLHLENHHSRHNAYNGYEKLQFKITDFSTFLDVVKVKIYPFPMMSIPLAKQTKETLRKYLLDNNMEVVS